MRQGNIVKGRSGELSIFSALTKNGCSGDTSPQPNAARKDNRAYHLQSVRHDVSVIGTFSFDGSWPIQSRMDCLQAKVRRMAYNDSVAAGSQCNGGSTTSGTGSAAGGLTWQQQMPMNPRNLAAT